MDESGTFRVLEIFTYNIFTFLTFFSFRFMLILIICSDRRANNTLPVISEVYYCNFNYIMKYDIKVKKIIITLPHVCVTLCSHFCLLMGILNISFKWSHAYTFRYV